MQDGGIRVVLQGRDAAGSWDKSGATWQGYRMGTKSRDTWRRYRMVTKGRDTGWGLDEG